MAQGDAEALYWGPIDAMNQFCETKYLVSPYVAEFWNCMSNIPCFILPAVYCLHRGHAVFDVRIKLVWFCMLVVGLGSFMFHGTMRVKWEMLDEGPMLLLVLAGIHSKDDTHWIMSGRMKVFFHVVGWTLATLGVYLYVALQDYEMFVHTFTALILLDLVICCMIAKESSKSGSSLFYHLLLAYIVTIGFGKFLWEIERRACTPGAGGALAFLHVAWHFFAGLACYFGCLADTHNRFAVLGVGCAVDAHGNLWPLVRLFQLFGMTKTSDKLN